jgi:hypothetical protein
VNKYSKGLSLVESIVASAVVSIFVGAMVFSYSTLLRITNSNLESIKATFLIEEGVEAMKFFRDADWQNISSLTTGSNYYLNFNGSSWDIVTQESLIDDLFLRVLVLDDVFRDSNGELVQSGGTLDTGSKRLSVSVSWLSGSATTTKSVSTYITDI